MDKETTSNGNTNKTNTEPETLDHDVGNEGFMELDEEENDDLDLGEVTNERQTDENTEWKWKERRKLLDMWKNNRGSILDVEVNENNSTEVEKEIPNNEGTNSEQGDKEAVDKERLSIEGLNSNNLNRESNPTEGIPSKNPNSGITREQNVLLNNKEDAINLENNQLTIKGVANSESPNKKILITKNKNKENVSKDNVGNESEAKNVVAIDGIDIAAEKPNSVNKSGSSKESEALEIIDIEIINKEGDKSVIKTNTSEANDVIDLESINAEGEKTNGMNKTSTGAGDNEGKHTCFQCKQSFEAIDIIDHLMTAHREEDTNQTKKQDEGSLNNESMIKDNNNKAKEQGNMVKQSMNKQIMQKPQGMTMEQWKIQQYKDRMNNEMMQKPPGMTLEQWKIHQYKESMNKQTINKGIAKKNVQSKDTYSVNNGRLTLGGFLETKIPLSVSMGEYRQSAVPFTPQKSCIPLRGQIHPAGTPHSPINGGPYHQPRAQVGSGISPRHENHKMTVQHLMVTRSRGE